MADQLELDRRRRGVGGRGPAVPDGRLPGRRWRTAIWVTLAGATLLFVGQALSAETTGFSGGRNPLAVDSPLVDVAWPVGSALLVTGLVAAVVSSVLRYRRARGSSGSS